MAQMVAALHIGGGGPRELQLLQRLLEPIPPQRGLEAGQCLGLEQQAHGLGVLQPVVHGLAVTLGGVALVATGRMRAPAAAE